jgi:hypothetical protein
MFIRIDISNALREATRHSDPSTYQKFNVLIISRHTLLKSIAMTYSRTIECLTTGVQDLVLASRSLILDAARGKTCSWTKRERLGADMQVQS